MKAIKICLLILCVVGYLSVTTLYSQDNNCSVTNTTFTDGEELSYTVSYNWFIVYTEVGKVNFSVNSESIFGQPSLHLLGVGTTYKAWDLFFKVRDRYESWVNPTSLDPYYFKRHVREGNYKMDLEYVLNSKDTVAYSKYKVNDNPVELDTISIKPCIYDLMSILYYARNLNFSSYQPGDTIPVNVLLDREVYHLFFRYKGVERIKIRHVGEFECIKFSVLLVEGTVFHGGEDMIVWVTNDKNRIPVYLESPILVGSVKVFLNSYKGLKYPLTSKIK
jgi:hypothetical protein